MATSATNKYVPVTDPAMLPPVPAKADPAKVNVKAPPPSVAAGTHPMLRPAKAAPAGAVHPSAAVLASAMGNRPVPPSEQQIEEYLARSAPAGSMPGSSSDKGQGKGMTGAAFLATDRRPPPPPPGPVPANATGVSYPPPAGTVQGYRPGTAMADGHPVRYSFSIGSVTVPHKLIAMCVLCIGLSEYRNEIRSMVRVFVVFVACWGICWLVLRVCGSK